MARPNPGATIDGPVGAYAAGPARRVGEPGGPVGDEGELDDEPRGTSPWLWVTAALAVAILVLAAFLLSRFLTPSEPVEQVTVPSLVGLTFEEAREAATDLGLEVVQVAFEQASAEVGTVIRQDPAAGETVDVGTEIDLTMAKSADLTIVPDLRFRTEGEALNLIFQASLVVGVRTDAFDDVVPVGQVISHVPFSGQGVALGTAVDYVVSKGPEPTPEPTPTPQPTPTPVPPTPIPTPPPPPPPTPTPTPAPIAVGEYRCVLLALAQSQIENDGFEVGSISGPNDPASIVIAQDPAPGTPLPPGSEIDLTTQEQPVETCPPA